MNTDFFALLQPALSAADAADVPDIPAARLIPAALLGIAVIVVLITRFKLHPFLGLTLGSLTVGAVAAAVLPHAVGRYAAVPVGMAMVWLGWSLWSEQRTSATAFVAQRHGSDRDSVPAR